MSVHSQLPLATNNLLYCPLASQTSYVLECKLNIIYNKCYLQIHSVGGSSDRIRTWFGEFYRAAAGNEQRPSKSLPHVCQVTITTVLCSFCKIMDVKSTFIFPKSK